MDTTTLNIKFLTALDACDDAVEFVKCNNLESFPVSMLDQIQGDHNGWVSWIKNTLLSLERRHDSNGNMIHYKESTGYEYDANGNMVHYKDSDNYEYWQEFDSNGNMIHLKDSKGFEYWREYDSNGNMFHLKDSYGFEYWQEYDANGNMIHYKNSYGIEHQYLTEYYSNGQIKRYGDMILPNISS